MGWDSPDFEVVWPHEHVSYAAAHVADDPFVKIGGLGLGDDGLRVGIDETVHGFDLRFSWQLGNIVLVWVGDPGIMGTDI